MKISILSAVYNEELYLEEMIRSVQAQSHEHWELLFASDGSTDGTEDIIRREALLDSRIRLVAAGPKIGKVAAFNLAFESSTGELVVLLAGDDTAPLDSLSVRAKCFEGVDPLQDYVVAYFKLRTTSADPSQDAMTLPRGNSASHSGGSITLTRRLASLVFPIDSSLVSEDLWLTRSAEGVATEVLESPAVVLNYRIHPGNSNPRNRSFDEMSKAMGARHRAWRALLDCPRFSLSATTREELVDLERLEHLRSERRVLSILLLRRASLSNRMAYAAMSNPILFRIRMRFFKLFSGRRLR